jgi:alkylation response protein AidB-like acyl-CoA dehydrogenase
MGKPALLNAFIWKKFGEMGYFGIAYPEAYGGLNLDLFYTVIFLEELQKLNHLVCSCDVWHIHI